MKKMMDDSWVYRQMKSRMKEIKGTDRVHEEPMVPNDRSVKEESATLQSLGEEVGSEEGNPLEDGEACAGLEDEHRDGLLDKKTNNNGGPAVLPSASPRCRG